jgi:PPOX class probable F420-dependent enzyme
MNETARKEATGQDQMEFPGKYLSVTSFRPDDTPVATPVWFVQDGGRLLVETEADSYKVRRIRANPRVLVAPCGVSGRLKGEQVEARAEILGPQALGATREQMARKYRMDRIFILPIYRLVQRLRHKSTGEGDSVILQITPEAWSRA